MREAQPGPLDAQEGMHARQLGVRGVLRQDGERVVLRQEVEPFGMRRADCGDRRLHRMV